MLTIEEPHHYRYAFTHLGFRPFFLGGSLYAVVAVTLWFWLYQIDSSLLRQPGLSMIAWHGHEMLYGYAMAVIAGFLLTAVRNWTGIQTLHGPALLVMGGVWLTARLMPFIATPWSLPLMASLDLGFQLWLCVELSRAIINAKQWPQFGIVAKVALLLLGNLLFYLGLSGVLDNGVQWGLYTGLYIILSLVLLMARRVLPFFIEKGVGYAVSLTNYKWLDISSLVLMLLLWLVDLFLPWPRITALIAVTLAVLHTIRMAGWYTRGIWHKPLLWVLYIAYGWIVIGFAMKALSGFGLLNPLLAVHAFAYGGIGMMTLGMMARVSLGHTGRDVFAPPRLLAPLFLLLGIGALVRVLLPMLWPAHYTLWIGVAQLLWIAAFAPFVWHYAPMLVKARVDGRYG